MINHKIGLKILVFSLIVFFVSGCASTITSKVIPGENVNIKIQFKGNIDANNYYYLLVFSNYNMILFPDLFKYFVTPGQIYSAEKLLQVAPQEGINYFYKNYFYTWSDYVILSNTGFALYNSGDIFDKNTNETTHYDYTSNINFNPTDASTGNTINITFPLYMLSKMGNYMYFSFATCSKDDNKMNLLLDNLADYPYIKLEAITIKKGDDAFEKDIPESADILSWEVKIF